MRLCGRSYRYLFGNEDASFLTGETGGLFAGADNVFPNLALFPEMETAWVSMTGSNPAQQGWFAPDCQRLVVLVWKQGTSLRRDGQGTPCLLVAPAAGEAEAKALVEALLADFPEDAEAQALLPQFISS